MVSDKLFSIIIPCYNVEKYVTECLESIVNQTIDLNKLEIILVDDCSTDTTVDILKKYEALYPNNITLILLEDNGKQGRARNIGMQYASGKYLSFVDSDDIIRLDMYEILENAVSSGDYEVVQFRYQIFYNDIIPSYDIESLAELTSTGIVKAYEYSKNRKKYMLMNSIMNESCTQKIYLRTLIQDANLRFMEGCAYEEPLFTYPLKFLVNNILVIEKALYFYRSNNSGTTLLYMSNPATITDHVLVQLTLRKFIEQWNLANGYELETELYFIHAFYAEPFYFLKRRGLSMPIELWKYLKEQVLIHSPHYFDNPYLNDPSLEDEKKLYEIINSSPQNDNEAQLLINRAVSQIQL